MNRVLRVALFLSLAIAVGSTAIAIPGPVPALSSAAMMETLSQEEIHWEGLLAGALEFFVVFTPDGDGGYTATIDIPAQGLTGGELTEVVYGDAEIAFTLPIAPPSGATFKAQRDGGAAEGTLEQGGNAVPFTMEIVEEGATMGPNRPQTPQPPFPYEALEVSYANPADDTTLAGTLTIPAGAGPFPAALLITGSGPQNRDEELFGHKPFLVIADHLSRRGIAVLRVDDRGVGASSGDMATATSENFASDVLAGVRFLAARDDIDAGRIGLVGHSEGGIIAPIVAAGSDEVAFIVLLAGTGVSGSELMVMQLAAVQRSVGRPEDNVSLQVEAQRRLLKLAEEGADLASLTDAVAELTRIQISNVPEAQRPSNEELAPAIEAQANQLMAPWWRFFLAFEPRQALQNVDCPVLAMNGTLDTQVPSGPNLEAIHDALVAGGNQDVTIEELDGLNHLFQSAETGSPGEYATIEETFAPRALDILGDWILARVAAADGVS